MSVKWTKTALQSIDELAGFIAKDNPSLAISFVRELKSAVTKLGEHPGLGQAGRVPGTGELVHTKTT